MNEGRKIGHGNRHYNRKNPGDCGNRKEGVSDSRGGGQAFRQSLLEEVRIE